MVLNGAVLIGDTIKSDSNIVKTRQDSNWLEAVQLAILILHDMGELNLDSEEKSI